MPFGSLNRSTNERKSYSAKQQRVVLALGGGVILRIHSANETERQAPPDG